MTAASPPARSKAQLCEHPSGSAQPCSPNKGTHTRLDPPWPLQHRTDGAVAPGEQGRAARGHGSTSPHSWEDAGQPQPPRPLGVRAAEHTQDTPPSAIPLLLNAASLACPFPQSFSLIFPTRDVFWGPLLHPAHGISPFPSQAPHQFPLQTQGSFTQQESNDHQAKKKKHQEVAGPRKMGQNLNPFQPKSLIHSHPGSSGLCPAQPCLGSSGMCSGAG